MRIPVSISNDRIIETLALVDSGAGGIFIDRSFALSQGLTCSRLLSPIPVFNVDGTPNQQGFITHCVRRNLTIAGVTQRTRFLVTALGNENIILGLPWLRQTNAKVDWKRGLVDFNEPEQPPDVAPSSPKPKATVETVPDLDDSTLRTPTKEDEPDDTPDLLLSLEPDELLISYIQGEPVLGLFVPEETPITHDFPTSPPISSPSLQTLGRCTHWKTSSSLQRFSIGQRTRVIAKLNPAMEMAQRSHEKEKSRSFEDMVPEIYHGYKDVFEKKAAERFPESRPYDHAIDLKPDFVPRNCKVYPLSPKEQTALDEFIDENLRKGYIRPSKSPQASPFFFVSKKDGSLRPCQDYRYLNEGTIKNSYPLPLVPELVDKFQGATIFSKMDLQSGYNNVRIKDGDQWKAAFKCSRGLYEPTVMFFGLCNSPPTFQEMMNDIFRDMIDEGWMVIYMDDILIFSKDPQTHSKRTLRVLQRLRDHDLFLKPEKCFFDVAEVEFLGLIIRPGIVAMDPTKLQGIQEWPTPTTVKGVRSFLGFGNFYRRFISHYSDLARPLHDLTKKDVPWTWSSEQQTAFDELKSKFIESPVLLLPDKTKPFTIESDTSKFATGAVLRQADANGDMHPCAYLSKSFDSAQRNYEIYDRELLGIVRSLEEWRHYLEGSPHPIEVLSDHQNLTYFRTARKVNRRQA